MKKNNYYDLFENDESIDDMIKSMDDPTWKIYDVNTSKTDEEVLDGVDIQVIEKYLRKKKLTQLNKE